MTAIDLPRPARHPGWLAWLACALRLALSALLRPRPDMRALSPHMRRDIGLVDSAHVEKQP